MTEFGEIKIQPFNKQAVPVQRMYEFDVWAVGDRYQPAYNNTPPDTMTWKGQQKDLIINYKLFLF